MSQHTQDYAYLKKELYAISKLLEAGIQDKVDMGSLSQRSRTFTNNENGLGSDASSHDRFRRRQKSGASTAR